MREAELEVHEWTGTPSVRIWLRYYYWSSNRWSCLPGYLAAKEGYWTTSGLSNSLNLFDDDGRLIATAFDMDVQYIGYPFDGLKGDTGNFMVLLEGLLHYSIKLGWEFIVV